MADCIISTQGEEESGTDTLILGKFYIVLTVKNVTEEEVRDMRLVKLGALSVGTSSDFDYDAEASSIDISIAASSRAQFIKIMRYFSTNETEVVLYIKRPGAFTWSTFFNGYVDRKSVSSGGRAVIEFTAAEGTSKTADKNCNFDPVPGESTHIRLQDAIEALIDPEGNTNITWYSKLRAKIKDNVGGDYYAYLTGGASDPCMYVPKEFIFSDSSAFVTRGEALKALLANIGAVGLSFPFRRYYILPMYDDGKTPTILIGNDTPLNSSTMRYDVTDITMSPPIEDYAGRMWNVRNQYNDAADDDAPWLWSELEHSREGYSAQKFITLPFACADNADYDGYDSGGFIRSTTITGRRTSAGTNLHAYAEGIQILNHDSTKYQIANSFVGHIIGYNRNANSVLGGIALTSRFQITIKIFDLQFLSSFPNYFFQLYGYTNKFRPKAFRFDILRSTTEIDLIEVLSPFAFSGTV